MMAAARRIAESDASCAAGDWTAVERRRSLGSDVHGATLGIIGMGRIGQAIARRGARGFDMRVLYHNRSRPDAAIEARSAPRYVEQGRAAARVRSPRDRRAVLAPQSHHLVGAAELALMKPTATLINIARGGIVDDAALVAALRDGRIAAAGLDVFEGEPRCIPACSTLPQRRADAAHRQRLARHAHRDVQHRRG